MKINLLFGAASILAIASLAVGLALGQGGGEKQALPPPGMALTSPDFEDGGVIPNRFTQANATWVSPKLDWKNVPPGTVSFALIAWDPDVAIEKTTEEVLHWLIFNIPGSAKGLPQGVPATSMMPDGTIQGKNQRDLVGYLGPGQGPQGPYHHYTFDLYALDTKLGLGEGATRADVLKAINGHILGKAVLVGRFHQ
jgi:Raf kinase inhibitor-like YbhB/YbcL family protein